MSSIQEQFHEAVLAGNTTTVGLILKKHPDALGWEKEFKGFTGGIGGGGLRQIIKRLKPLHMAALEGHVKTAELLLDHGAEINAEIRSNTKDRAVPLTLAAGAAARENAPKERKKYKDTMVLLILRGADLKIAFERASIAEDAEIKKALPLVEKARQAEEARQKAELEKPMKAYSKLTVIKKDPG